MGKFILFLPLLLLPFLAIAEVDCEKHKIYCKIKELRPLMSDKETMNLSNLLYKKAKKYKGDPFLAVAIGMQETGLKQKHREQNIIQFYEECDENGCVESWRVERGFSDVCMFQFHVNTIANYKIDPIKLKNDLSYCVDWHFKLMKIKKEICRKIEKPWTCYHNTNKLLRRHYANLVERYL